jgi:hypothetical protein
MTNETKSVELFITGLISNPDAQDIADDAYVAGSNIDPNGEGLIVGIPIPTQVTTNADARSFQQGCFIKRDSGEYDLIYHEGNDICAITDFYGTPAYSVVQASATGTSFVPHNQEVYIASSTPRWVGRTSYEQFGVNTYKDALVIQNAEIPRSASAAGEIYIASVTGHVGSNAFSLGSTYTYALSMVYDGLQESPISSTVVTFTPAYTDYDYNTVTIKCNAGYSNLAGVNRRITGCKLYRKETKYTVSTSGDEYKIDSIAASIGNYQLLQVINVADDSGLGYGSTSWGHDATDYTITYVDNNDSILGTYESETKMPETLETFHVTYALNTYGNGYMFVGNCSISGFSDSSHMIFRSRDFRYSMFDWTNDYVKLESVPTAMAFYNTRLFVFDDNNAYIINPDTLDVEDRKEGAGCPSQKSVYVSDKGITWVNKYNIFLFDGDSIKILTDRIKNNWVASATSVTPVVLYDTIKNVLLIHVGENAYYWHFDKERWDYSSNFTDYLGAGTFTGGFVGKFGETYSANGVILMSNFTGATTRDFSYTSKTFTFDSPGQLKEFYWLTVSSDSTITITYSIDEGANYRSLTNTDEIKDTNGLWEKKKTLKVKLVGAATRKVYNYETVFRRMRGNRA